MDIEKMRQDILSSDMKRDSGLSEPKGIIIEKDISYGPYGVDNLLDIYYPENVTDEKGTIINVHGGGFFYGSKEIYKHYTMFLATQGFKVLNFNYRLAPEHTYPAPLEDINQLMNWMIQTKEQYNFDLTNVFLIGDSAGAQLTEQYATILTNDNYANLFDFTVPTITIKAIALNCGLYFHGEKEPIDKDFPFYFKHVARDEKQFPVENYITSYFPPSYVMTSSHDFLKELAPPLVNLLKQKNVPVVYKEYKMEDLSELNHVFHLNQKTNIARECNLSELAFFETFIK